MQFDAASLLTVRYPAVQPGCLTSLIFRSPLQSSLRCVLPPEAGFGTVALSESVLRQLIIFRVHFEIALRMSAHGASLGSFYADYNMPAIAAFPHRDFVLRKHFSSVNIAEQRTETLLVKLFDRRNRAETFRKFVKAFLLGCRGKIFVHSRPFVVFALRGGFQVFFRIGKFAQFFKPEFCVLLFIIRRFQKQGGDLFISLLLCLCAIKK